MQQLAHENSIRHAALEQWESACHISVTFLTRRVVRWSRLYLLNLALVSRQGRVHRMNAPAPLKICTHRFRLHFSLRAPLSKKSGSESDFVVDIAEKWSRFKSLKWHLSPERGLMDGWWELGLPERDRWHHNCR